MPVLARLTLIPAYRNPCQTASTDSQRNQDTPGQISVPTNTADRNLSQLSLGGNHDICLCLPPDKTWHRVYDPKVGYCEDLGEGKVGYEPRLEPCWTMPVIGPDYSLNWTAMFSAIQGWHTCQWCSSPTRRWPNRNRRPFGLKSVFAGQCSLGSKPTAN